MKALGIAVIGLHMGASYLQSCNEIEGAHLAAVCDLDEQLLSTYAGQFPGVLASTRYQDVVSSPDVDIVSIAAPDEFHMPMTQAACANGKHVLVEKPMARTIEECELMIGAAGQAGVKLMVAHVCRFHHFFEEVKRWSEDGTLGAPYYIETSYIHNYAEIGGVGNWRFDPHKRHPLVGGGCHAVDLARWLCGDIEEVHAYGNHFNIPQQQWEDHIVINAKFKSGVIGRIMNSSGCTHPYNIECEVWGTNGTIVGDNTSDNARICLRSIDRLNWMEYPSGLMVKAIGNEIGHFVDCIHNDREPLIDGVDGAKTVATCWAAIESIATGQPVKVRNEF